MAFQITAKFRQIWQYARMLAVPLSVSVVGWHTIDVAVAREEGPAISAHALNPMYGYPPKEALIPYTSAKLDPGSRLVLDTLATYKGPPPWTIPPRQLRENFDALFSGFNLPRMDIADRETRIISGPNGPVPIRIFRPRNSGKTALPVLVYYHGGGMMMNSTDTYDSMLQIITSESGAAVISVDFRLAPEHRFPVGLEDSYFALKWVHDNAKAISVDPARIAIGGDSGGGYLTAAVSQLARDRGGPALIYQIMIYPAVGTRGNSRSVDLYSEGYFFSREELAWTYAQYIGDSALFDDPRVQPILATDFSNLPPALIIVPEFDILRDDGEEYGALLKAAGVPVDLHRYDGTIHAFLNMARVIPAGRAAMSEVATKLRQVFFGPEAAPSR